MVARDAEWHAQRSRPLGLRPHERRLAPARDAARPQPHAADQRRRSGARAVAAHPDGRARRSARAHAPRPGDGASPDGPASGAHAAGRPGRLSHACAPSRPPASPTSPTSSTPASGSTLRRRRAPVRGAGPAGRRLAGQPRARAAPRRAAPTTTTTSRLEATNVCVASCLFCSFARLKPGDAGAYTMSLEQVLDKLRAARRPAAHRSPHRQRAAPRPAVQLLHGPAARA